LGSNFANWKDQLNFLLRFMQMMRARSPLFFAQMRADLVRLNLPADHVRAWTVATMTREIQKGVDWLSGFDWTLRWTDSPLDPVIATEQPWVVEGRQRSLADALLDGESLLYFPLCWQACLIGSRRYFQLDTDRFHPHYLKFVRAKYIEFAEVFVISPTKLEP
jgi:hypothetical protein